MTNLPFEHLNLRRNPFGNLPDAARRAVAIVDVARYRERLAGGEVAVEFVGPSGRGKTTHLLALEEGIEGAEYLDVDPDGTVAEPSSAPILLIDEFQFLEAPRRSAILEQAAGLGLGTHESVRPELEAAGYEVETVELTRERGPALESLLRERIEWARRGEGAVPEFAPEVFSWLRERYGTDLRAVEKHLYEVFQALEEPRTVVISDLEAIDRWPERSEALRSCSDT